MNADDLRAVAAEIREKANVATPSPWWQEGHEIWASRDSSLFVIGNSVRNPDDPDLPHIAAWHPAVALAVADWLEAEAKHRFYLLPIETIAFVKAWRGDS